MYIHTSTYIHTYIHIHTYTYIHAYIHTYIHTYVHIYMHTHTYIISRRKRKEVKDIKIYLHNKPLEQVSTMKYLGIILDKKFKFSEHVSYAAERCTKLIHSLSKSAKTTWALKHEALKTIYKGAILPLLLYGAPVWNEAMKYEYNKRKYIGVQRLMNIKNSQGISHNFYRSTVHPGRNDSYYY